jgi:hypothetical protein
MQPRAWTESDEILLRELWNTGKTVDHIKAALKRGRDAIASHRVILGLPDRAKNKTDLLNVQQIHSLRQTGLTWDEIGKKLNCNGKNISRWYRHQPTEQKKGVALELFQTTINPAATPVTIEPIVVTDKGIPYEQTSKFQCQHPLNDRFPWIFCGKPIAPDRPYCEDHMKLNFVVLS